MREFYSDLHKIFKIVGRSKTNLKELREIKRQNSKGSKSSWKTLTIMKIPKVKI